MNHSKFPRAIEIQTISACNAKCTICPHPQVSLELPSGSMSMEFFKKIIDQVDPSWNCRIIPYLNSEPMLDPFITRRLRYVCERLGNPEMEISTNVSALTPSKQEEMIGIYLTELRLSVFGFTPETHAKLMPGLKWGMVRKNLDYLVSNKALRASIGTISIVVIDHPLVTQEDINLAQKYCTKHGLQFNFWGFLDRARNVQDYSNDVDREVIFGCEQQRPLERMHIMHTGDVVLCCQDWRWQNKIGNVSENSILDIWNGEAYQEYRRRIYDGKGRQPEICSRCKLSVPVA